MADILIVDDSAPLREVMKEVLTDAGHTVSEAADGLAAEACCRKASFDLIVTDIFMPEKEGMETIRELRKRYPQVRILAISGGDSVTEPDSFLNLAIRFGANGALAKPFEQASLVAKVKELLAEG